MQIKNAVLLATTASLSLSACTTSLQSLPDLDRTDAYRQAIPGSTYALPMLTYDIAVTRALTNCASAVVLPPIVADDKKTAVKLESLWRGGMQIALSGKATPEMIVGERYKFNPAKLVGPSKTTNFVMTYWEGTDLLKGVNSTMDDQTGQILGDLVATGLAVSSIVIGPAGLAGAAGVKTLGKVTETTKTNVQPPEQLGQNFYNLETNTTLDLLNKLESVKHKPTKREKQLQHLTELLESSAEKKQMVVCTDEAATKLALLASLKEDKSKLAKAVEQTRRSVEDLLASAAVRPLTQDQRVKLAGYIDEIDGNLRKADDVQRDIDDTNAALATTMDERWPKTFQERKLTALNPGDSASFFKGMLKIATLRVVNPGRLGAALQNEPELRTTFATWVADYVWPDGTPKYKTDSAKPQRGDNPACVGAGADVDACLATLLPVAVSLDKSEGRDVQNCPDNPAAGSDCLRNVKTPADLKSIGAIDARDSLADKGLFVRPPVMGELKLCRANPEPPHNKPDTDTRPFECAGSDSVIAKAVLVPQLGQLRFVPLKNEIFENSGLVMNIDKNGQPTDVSYISSKAAGASFAAAAAKISADAKDFDDDRRKQAKENREAQAKQDAADAAKADAKDAVAKGVDPATRAGKAELASELQADADLAKARRAAAIAKACLANTDKDAASVTPACPAIKD